ncbi:filamentous hemagglutinin family protein [Rhodopseudomonas rhenobacensis]|uniref:Filamentous hemagglutinin family protein n=1 Tax=Rhodopseudomonas rhenobacensis TaxID=87461 RepID=A0A7W7Z5B1_9BRAD|nr:filamentous hemagglutinin family protein [Rhodopseudomonas rhenobacensis]
MGVSAAALLLGFIAGAEARSLGGGGSATTTAATAAAAAAQASAQQSAATASQAMMRASAAVQSLRAAQTAARAAAMAASSAVPNGLTPGGLVMAPGATPSVTDGGAGLWQGANLPTQAVSGGRTQVEIKQTEAKAILTWQSFNVGRDTDLYFNQSAGGDKVANWIALNRVLDPSLAPSRILGRIGAEGQVYVINRNGIIFDGSSQVDVHTLVASSLSLSNAQFMAGINKPLSIPDIYSSGADNSIPTFGDAPTSTTLTDAPVAYATPPGDVVVRAGALIESQVGGKAMLFAPHVVNAGTIWTPGGQAILAAGENVWLADPLITDQSSTLRGLDVAASSPTGFLLQYYALSGEVMGWNKNPVMANVLAAMDARAASVGYSVTNTGVVEAARGNISVVAREINQNGALIASTALNNQDGSIILHAYSQGFFGYGDGQRMFSWSSGTVNLGSASATVVGPDLTDTSSIEQTNIATRYRAGSVDLRGELIDIEAGATVVVPSGTITAVASSLPKFGAVPASSEKVVDGSRIYIGEGALLSVAGLQNVLLSMESNTVTAELRINELRDSVLYIDSWLRGATIYIDKRVKGTFTDGPMAGVQWIQNKDGSYQVGNWVGTPIGDVSAWIGTGTTTLAELSTTGGSITLKSGGDIITRAGSVLDVAGGSVRYASGYVTTTQLLGADGRIYNIGSAMPDQVYVGLAGGFTRDHAHWGIKETWTSILGRGSKSVRFEEGYTDGRNAGGIVIYNGAGLVMEGEIDGHVITGARQATGSSVATAGSLQLGGGSDPERSWLSSNIIVSNDPARLAAGFTVASALSTAFFDTSVEQPYRAKTTYLDADMLSESGIGTFNLFYNKTFEVATGTALELAPGATLNIFQNLSPSATTQTNVSIDGSIRVAGGTIKVTSNNGISIGAHATLDVSGLWFNEFTSGTAAEAPKVNGGSITLDVNENATKVGIVGGVEIAATAVLDVSGGGWLRQVGGKPKLKVGDAGAIKIVSLVTTDLAALDLRGYAAGSGGSISIVMLGDMQVGGTKPADPATIYLPAMLWADRGFRAVNVATDGDVEIPDGATVSQLPVNVDMLGADYASVATGMPITAVGKLRVLDLVDRLTRKSASLTISSPKTITLGSGATLASDVKGSITLTQGEAVNTGAAVIKGSIDAPAGVITINANKLTVAGGARLTARGVAAIVTDPATGLRTGTVLNGGTVSLTGAMALEASVLIDVSGTAGVIDDPQRARGSNATVLLASDGGTISLTGGTSAGSTIDAGLLAKAGGAGASGGTLTLTNGAVLGSAQNSMPTATTTYIGYFKLVGAGGKYSYDPATGAYYANAASGTYNFVGGTAFGTAAAVIDLDPYDEYGTTAYKLPAAMRSAINNLSTLTAASMQIVNGLAADAPAPDGIKPWVQNTAITEKAVVLLNKYFYAAIRSGPSSAYVYTPGTKIKIADIAGASVSVSANAINNGGFGAVNLPGVKLGNGVNLNLPGAALSIGRLTAPSVGASAEINAAYIALGGNVNANTAPAGGTLTLTAELIDVTAGVTRGYGDTKLIAGDIRLVGNDFTPNPLLNVDGTLTLQAAQIYPATQTIATITAADRIVVLPNGTAAAPLSAGGSLTLSAPDIDIYGTVRVPFGSLTLSASHEITLGAEAVVSVSGDGLTVPYGVLLNGDTWALQTSAGGVPVTIAAPPQKKITLDAPSVTMASGSTTDIRGGGDLYASEFVVGSGGSHNILTMAGVYAILPASGSVTAPSSALAVGSRVWLAGGNGLAAGWYTLLPAQYALLPGAMAIQMVAGSSGKSLPKPFTMNDGTVLMSGRLGNALDGSTDALSSNFRVMSGRVVRAYSEYNEATANAFFSSDAFRLTQYRLTGLDVVTPQRPMDGGSVVFKAINQLTLDGQLQSVAADGGRAGLVDIAAAKIAVLGAGQDTSGLAGYLIIDSSRLSGFGAASLLLGGVRTQTATGLAVEVFANSIEVRNDGASALVGPEIILAASDGITIAAGSALRAEGKVFGGSGNLIMKPQVAEVWSDNGTSWDPKDDYMVSPARDYGALIRLSNGDVVAVNRTNADGSSHGNVSIGAGAVLSGGKALLIDATRSATLASSAALSAADITLSGSRIGFGGGSSGLVFDAASLARFNAAQNLTLRSYSSIDFYTAIDFGSAGLKSVTLDATGLVGRSAAATTITGETVVLRNTVGAFSEPAVADQGALTLDTNQLVLGSGAKILRGFGAVTLNAAGRVVGQGDGSLDAGSAAIRIVTPLITALNGAGQAVTTTGGLAVVGGVATQVARDAASLGSRWSFTAAAIDFGGRVDALGGRVALTAVGGDVVLGGGASIDVGGFDKTFNDVTATSNAGTISLTSVGGSVRANAGSMLNLAAAAGGGDAGTLSAVASGGGSVDLAGTIDAHASSGKGGAFTLDIGALPDFDGFSQRLEAAGFTRSRQFRIRSGDVVLDGNTVVEDFVLSADAGTVTIIGRIDASAAYGGSIAIAGGNGLVMTSSANLMARSTTALGSGRVTLEASGGALDISGGVIDVSGGERGRVRFRALQNSTHDGVAVSNLQVDISGARAAVLEAVAVYDSADGRVETPWAGAVTDAASFMAAAPGIAATISSGIAVMAGIEIRSAGDLTLNASLDLASTFSGHQGGLTLRAAGNLNILGNISDGFSDATKTGALLAQQSWDLRLVAGADLSSANSLAVTPIAGLASNSGSLVIGDASNGYLVRTGTGDLAARAGRDIRLANYQSVIYTAGKQDTTVYADFSTGSTGAVYGIQGGNLGIAAGGSISSTLPTDTTDNMLFTNWLKKAGMVNNAFVFTGQQSTWWIDYSGFTQGVGALGGGNVNVQAGGDLDNLLVALATTGRVHGGTVTADDKVLQVDNGGAMTVVAGGAVKAGSYYIARGAATIDAGTFENGRQVTSTVTGGNAPVITTYDIAPMLALGDATLNVRTAGDLRLQTVLDPLLAYDPHAGIYNQTYLLGITGNSQLNLTSVGGNVTLVNQARYLSQDVETASFWHAIQQTTVQFANQYAGNLYPALTHITALNGSVSNLGQLSTLPAARSELTILAAQDIDLGNILMARATPDMLPSPFHPISGSGSALQYYDLSESSTDKFLALLENPTPGAYVTASNEFDRYLRSVGNPGILPNAGDYEPSRIYALNGSVRSGKLISNEQTWISAGVDIRNVGMNLRNLHGTDVSWLNAGNDVIQRYLGITFPPFITIQGPGDLLVTAGRDIYADELRIISTGNRTYINGSGVDTAVKGLSSYGSSIELLAGLHGQQPDYAAVEAAYVDPSKIGTMPSYLTVMINGELWPLYLTEKFEVKDGVIVKQLRFGLASFIYDTTGRVFESQADLWAAYQALPVLTQQRFLRQVYMQELREAGRDHNNGSITGGYQRGYDAVAALFPGDAWKGDVQSGNALIRTGFGGDIRVMTPGGGLQVAALNQAVDAGYGLVTLGYGRIEIFADQDVVVNRSRILTFTGGDIIIWSTLGDIDAGKGAKTTRVPSAPLIATDDDGVTRVTERTDISGSGIGTILGVAGVEAGDVDLIAPVGTVDAGDAGIRVAGNFNVAALFVLNTDNIKVGGEIKGVPKAEAPAVSLTLDTKDKAAADAVKDATQQTANDRPSVIIVEVLGYGGGGPGPADDERSRDKDKDKDKDKDDRHGRLQDSNGPAHVVGYGSLTEQQKRLLTEAEKRNL